jgi:predicted CoA-binding protein
MLGPPDDVTLRRILAETRNIAVVGASDKPTRPSHEIYADLVSTGEYQVCPVNPMISEIDGASTYSVLSDLPAVPDMVDVFWRFDELPSVLADTLALEPRPKTLWLQEGSRSKGTAARASGPRCRGRRDANGDGLLPDGGRARLR